MLASLFSTATTTVTFSMVDLLLSMGASLLLGCVVAASYMYKNFYTKNFVVTLAILPLLVQLVIMLVNGNLGAGVAVLGAFSLIRFRSVPGGSKEIVSIFWSMGIGLATGMGYIGYAALFSVVTFVFYFLLNTSHFGKMRPSPYKHLKVTLAEDLDFPEIFDDLLKKYTVSNELQQVKTTEMGSLFELNYLVELKDLSQQKQFIDELRVRNGNLPISLNRVGTQKEEL
ncbi:DUF4956 domain-containing protein [Enterococcus timonensis]|uniref:DUF4956 domain-containing protein n=1 Tax=Enterococcus timonensis TaxID=1852364 RepID=UPI0008DA2A02|nr:DUF4956 domain-containing protein [Enterococcus timonensis]